MYFEPIVANWFKNSGLESELAPKSKNKVPWSFLLGNKTAIAGLKLL